ncbi:MAG: CAP domain-containing protein [Nannocystaceae bacterium]|nr:CAP domain-containing protein [Nannocystaceae bacterium]
MVCARAGLGLVVVVASVFAACEGGGGGDGGSSGGSGDGDGSSSAGEAASDSAADSSGGNPDDAAAMCMRWLSDRADLSEGAWSGDVASCDPGDVPADARDRALGVLNLYRWLADLPPITLDDTLNEKTQACALMMDANATLSHTPPTSWTCYSEVGAEAAGSSNIATTAGVASIDLYMMDPGNPDTIGHRRWILSNSIGPTGIGSTNGYSCLWTIGGSGAANAPWVAYPPPGPFPLSATTIGFANLDQTGWSIQSDTLDFTAATFTITRDGETLPVMQVPLLGGYGSTFATSLLPMGWTTTVGEYHVVIEGVGEPITYDVQIVDCGG